MRPVNSLMHNPHTPEACIANCMIGHALDGMCVGLVLMNQAGRIAWFNRAAERTLGLTRPGSLGKLLTQVIKDPHLAAFWHDARVSEEARLENVSIQFPRAAELKINAAQCLDTDGSLLGRVLLFCDVTHERAAQVELSQQVADRLLGLACDWQPNSAPAAGLTPTELRVLRMIGDGAGNNGIATELGVAPSTVRSHVKHIYRKLKLRSRAEAVSFAVRNRLA